jgi:hypothetical protein
MCKECDVGCFPQSRTECTHGFKFELFISYILHDSYSEEFNLQMNTVFLFCSIRV